MKKYILLFILMLSVLCLTGCVVKEKEFSGDGITIKLTSDFEVYETEKWGFYVENEKIAVMSSRQSKLKEMNGVKLETLTLHQYMAITLLKYEIDADVYTVQGVLEEFYYCYYTAGTKYAYMFAVMSGKDHFYTINLCTDYDTFNEDKILLFNYAVNISVE